jgi:hypothetical protein
MGVGGEKKRNNVEWEEVKMYKNKECKRSPKILKKYKYKIYSL